MTYFRFTDFFSYTFILLLSPSSEFFFKFWLLWFLVYLVLHLLYFFAELIYFSRCLRGVHDSHSSIFTIVVLMSISDHFNIYITLILAYANCLSMSVRFSWLCCMQNNFLFHFGHFIYMSKLWVLLQFYRELQYFCFDYRDMVKFSP